MLRTREGRATNPGAATRPNRQSRCLSPEDPVVPGVIRRALPKVSIAAGSHSRRRPPPS